MNIAAETYKSTIIELWNDLNPSVEKYRLHVSAEPGKPNAYDELVYLELYVEGRIIKADALLATPDWEVPVTELREWLQRWIGELS